MIAERRALALSSFGAATTAEFLQTTILEATEELPQFDLTIIQTHFFMQQMLIFSASAEEYKFDLIIVQAQFLNPAMLIFLCLCRQKSKRFC